MMPNISSNSFRPAIISFNCLLVKFDLEMTPFSIASRKLLVAALICPFVDNEVSNLVVNFATLSKIGKPRLS